MKLKMIVNTTALANRERTKVYLQGLENQGRWVVRHGEPISPKEAYDTLLPFTNVIALPVISVSDVIEDALREADNAKHKVNLIASRSTINVGD